MHIASNRLAPSMLDKLIGLFAAHLITYWGTVMYTYQYPQMKPSRSIWNILPRVFFNQLVVSPAVFYFCIPLLNWEVPKVSHMAIVSAIVWTAIMSLLILNPLFAVLHYGVHQVPYLHKTIHRVHHRLHVPQGAGAIYAHWIEHILVNLLPVVLGPIILQTNYLTNLLFIVFVSSETVLGHTAFTEGSSRHVLHHMKINCNYDNSPYGFDRIMGTLRNWSDKDTS